MEVGRFFNQESVDMNALYQQDIDLGVNWPAFEPVKSLDNGSFEKKISFDPKDYIVDGETGEYMPIPQKDETPKPILDDGETGQTAEFNIEEFLDSSISAGANQMNVQQVNEQQFQQVQASPETINTELWDDIATLSEAYLALDSGEFANEGMSDTSSPMEENVQFTPVNQFQNDVYSNQAQIQLPEQQKGHTKDQYFSMNGSYHSFPTPPYAEQSDSPPATFTHPTAVSFPADGTKQFSPADLEEVKLAEILMNQQQSDLLAQLDNISQVNSGSNPSPISSEEVTPPGSWFFGGEEPANNFSQVLTELDVMNNLQRQPGPYANPPNAPYVPPPLQNQGRVSMVSESESLDSGFSDVGITTMDMDIIEVEPTSVQMPAESDQGFMSAEMIKETKAQRRASQRESRDLKKARELNINLTLEQIINSPVEEYNELLARSNLNPAQQSLVRDIRRRGKNKVAAQNCRKRKIETISSMEIDIDGLNMKRQELLNKQKEIEATKHNVQSKYNQLYQQIFSSLRDESGRPYDQSRFSLQQVEGAIILVPGNPNNRREDKSDSKGTVAFFDLSKVKLERDF